MFGEAALGESAAALERALTSGQAAETCMMLAREMLALADRSGPADLRKAGGGAG
jgi:uncharacterized protein HemY